jgi:hypothetical protein
MQPSEPGIQSVISTAPEAPSGITHFPDLQTPLAQSGPVSQLVFGSCTVGMQSLPVHVPLWHSRAWLQGVPAGEPELGPPFEVEPALPPPETDAPAPVAPEPLSCPISRSLPPHPAKTAATRPTNSTHDERLGS